MIKLPTQTRLRKELKKLSKPQSGWTDVFPAIMGKADGTVLTSIPGVVWIHNLLSGQDFAVFNNAVENTPLLQVEIGKRVGSSVWEVKGTAQPFSVPASSGPTMPNHGERHRFPNADTVWIDRKQIRHLTVLVSNASNFIVKLFGGIMLTANGITKIATQTVDLSSYVPAVGAVFVSIESDDDGVVTVNAGTGFDAPTIATVDDIPSPAAGKYTRAYVLLYDGQTALSNNDIVVPMPPDFNPVSLLAEAPEDGQLYGRKDAAWEVVPESSGSGTVAELLMEDGVTFPPVPLTNEDGTDWMYDY
jgi:hypothetical protein